MNRSKKWKSAALALALLAAGWLGWYLVFSPGSRQIITLSDGHQYEFAGTSCGTNSVPPGVLAHLVSWLPDSWADYLRAKLGPHLWLTQPLHLQEAMVVWLKPIGPRASAPFAAGNTIGINGILVAPGGSVESTPCTANYLYFAGAFTGESVYGGATGPQSYVFLWFPVVTHRQRTLECKLVEVSGNGVSAKVVQPDLGLLKFHNPLFGHYPQWQAEAVPATKPAGDGLNVRLKNFGKGTNGATYEFSLAFDSANGTNEKWTVSQIEVTDATGGHLAVDVRYPVGAGTYGIYNGMWPDEAAIKLKLTLKRNSGFLPSELMTFTNLPVLPLIGSYSPANGTTLTNRLNGIPITVRNILTDSWHARHAPRGGYAVELVLATQPSGVVGDILEVSTDAGDVLTTRDTVNPDPNTYIEYDRGLPHPAKSLNVTVAVQKTRTVEFLVKP